MRNFLSYMNCFGCAICWIQRRMSPNWEPAEIFSLSSVGVCTLPVRHYTPALKWLKYTERRRILFSKMFRFARSIVPKQLTLTQCQVSMSTAPQLKPNANPEVHYTGVRNFHQFSNFSFRIICLALSVNLWSLYR